jgi:hypothetical protein
MEVVSTIENFDGLDGFFGQRKLTVESVNHGGH